MSYCENCGFPLPEGAEYCPNCGVRVKKAPTPPQVPGTSLGRIIQAGVLGAFISVMISSLSVPDVHLYFIPSFVSSVLVVFLFRVRRLEEAVTIAFSVYLFADAVLGGIIFGSLYVNNIPLSEAYRGYMLSFLDVATYVFNPVSALIAAYLGNKLIMSVGPKTEKPEKIDYRLKEERGPGGVIYDTELDPRPHKV
jgi:hypothetical protein